MAYTKHNFVQYEQLKAQHMNAIETAIGDIESTIQGGVLSTDNVKSLSEIQAGGTGDSDVASAAAVKSLSDTITQVQSAAGSAGTVANANATKIGAMSSLQTTEKTTLVGAINELDGNFANYALLSNLIKKQAGTQFSLYNITPNSTCDGISTVSLIEFLKNITNGTANRTKNAIVTFYVAGTLFSDFPASMNTFGTGIAICGGYYAGFIYMCDGASHCIYTGRATITSSTTTWLRIDKVEAESVL